MSALVPLCHLMGIDVSSLTEEEEMLLETELFVLVCEELKEHFRQQHKEYYCLMNVTIEKENDMWDSKFIRSIINDIISTKEYNLSGIAYYTDTFEEVIVEYMTGRNPSPSANFLRKLIDLHRSVRRELYDFIFRKISFRNHG